MCASRRGGAEKCEEIEAGGIAEPGVLLQLPDLENFLTVSSSGGFRQFPSSSWAQTPWPIVYLLRSWLRLPCSRRLLDWLMSFESRFVRAILTCTNHRQFWGVSIPSFWGRGIVFSFLLGLSEVVGPPWPMLLQSYLNLWAVSFAISVSDLW